MSFIQALQFFFLILLALSSFGQQRGGYKDSGPQIQPQRHPTCVFRVPFSWKRLGNIALHFIALDWLTDLSMNQFLKPEDCRILNRLQLDLETRPWHEGRDYFEIKIQLDHFS